MPRQPLVIGIAGGSGSGKTTLANAILAKASCPGRVRLLSTDSFYKPLSDHELKHVSEYNFDAPESTDWDWLVRALDDLSHGKDTIIPEYDFVTHSRTKVDVPLQKADIIVVEGILLFFDKRVRDMCNLKLFMSVDNDTRLARRLRRDVTERGRSVDCVINQYLKTVKPAFITFVDPTRVYADIIVPDRGCLTAPINLIADTVEAHFRRTDSIDRNDRDASPNLIQKSL